MQRNSIINDSPPRRITRKYAKETLKKLYHDDPKEVEISAITQSLIKDQQKSRNIRRKSVERQKSPSRSKSPTRFNIKSSSLKITKSPKKAAQIALVAPSNRKESFEEKLIDSEIIEYQKKSSNEIPEIIYRKSGSFAYSYKPDKKIMSQYSLQYKENYNESKTINYIPKSIKINEDKTSEFLNDPSSPEKFIKNINNKIDSRESGWFLHLLYYFALMLFTIFSNQYYRKKFHWNSIPFNFESYFTPNAFMLLFGFKIIQVFLLLSPIGKCLKSSNFENNEYNFRQNGFLSILLSIGCLLIYHYYKFPTSWIVDHIIPLIISGCIFALIFSVILYIRAHSLTSPANPLALTGNHFNDFTFGREVNPKIGCLDVKILFLRVFANTTIMLNVLLVLNNKNMQNDFWLDTANISTLFISIYLLDILWFEEYFVTTFEYSKEGVGFNFILKYFLKPFSYVVLTRSLIETRHSFPWYCILAITISYLFGYLIYRLSNTQKSKFRINPLDRSISKIATFPTITGKKLLIGSLWRFVRHPNYLGDLIMHISMFSLLGTSDYLPYIFLIFHFIHLLNRISRIEKTCKNFYGVAWNRYCNIVKYKIIPGIF